jgi:hypothetical protein
MQGAFRSTRPLAPLCENFAVIEHHMESPEVWRGVSGSSFKRSSDLLEGLLLHVAG